MECLEGVRSYKGKISTHIRCPPWLSSASGHSYRNWLTKVPSVVMWEGYSSNEEVAGSGLVCLSGLVNSWLSTYKPRNWTDRHPIVVETGNNIHNGLSLSLPVCPFPLRSSSNCKCSQHCLSGTKIHAIGSLTSHCCALWSCNHNSNQIWFYAHRPFIANSVDEQQDHVQCYCIRRRLPHHQWNHSSLSASSTW